MTKTLYTHLEVIQIQWVLGVINQNNVFQRSKVCWTAAFDNNVEMEHIWGYASLSILDWQRNRMFHCLKLLKQMESVDEITFF